MLTYPHMFSHPHMLTFSHIYILTYVLLDMFLVILNLSTSVKVKLGMLWDTFNIVLINLCSSNIISAVLVKSFSIVHNAYAVTANSTQSDLSMCSITRLGQHLTATVLPWSVVVLSWLTVLPRIKRLQVSWRDYVRKYMGAGVIM